MVLWLRLSAALAITLIVLAGVEYWGPAWLLGDRSDKLPEAAQERARELFWMVVFAVAMATSVWAAARRWTSNARLAMVRRR